MRDWLPHFLALVGAIGLLGSGGCANGPAGFIPGGAFSAEIEPLPGDWTFARDLDSVDVQIDSDPPRTVRTGIVVYDNVPYLPVTWAPLKRWPDVVRERSAVVLRADGRHFALVATPVDEPSTLAVLRRTGQDKYGPPFHARSLEHQTFYFRLDPPS